MMFQPCTSMLLSASLFMGLLAAAAPTRAAEPDKRVYEMRVYYAAEGKLEALNARFRDHTVKLFEKHGITNVGYFEPLANPERQLIYFLAYPSREAREKSWAAFRADPAWTKAKAASEVDGKLVDKVEESFLQSTDYSPAIAPSAKGERVFEMRTYTAEAGRLENLNARFRDHTVKLFEKHGMTNIAYWVPMADQKGASDTLVYIISHKSPEAAKAGFAEFAKDPVWSAALKASEEKAGGSLTAKGGIKSVFMKATDYSPIR